MTLPTPDPAFHWSAEPWGHGLRCTPLEQYAQHLFTTRQLQLRPSTDRPGRPDPSAGSGSPRATSRGERLVEGRRPEGHGDHLPSAASQAYLMAWTQAAASVGAGLEQVLRVHQKHGAVVRVIRRGETTATSAADRPDGDALVSNASSFVLAVQVADCVPILMADKKSGAVAAVHAGWRGTCAGVVNAAIAAMSREFGTDSRNLCAAIGPSIGPCCYEVGESVLDEFRLVGVPENYVKRWFSVVDGGSLRLDLQTANRDQLAAAGVREDDIYVCGLCTKTHSGVFESYRADGELAGRMAGLIRVP